jgi:hypothetical protein
MEPASVCRVDDEGSSWVFSEETPLHSEPRRPLTARSSVDEYWQLVPPYEESQEHFARHDVSKIVQDDASTDRPDRSTNTHCPCPEQVSSVVDGHVFVGAVQMPSSHWL